MGRIALVLSLSLSLSFTAQAQGSEDKARLSGPISEASSSGTLSKVKLPPLTLKGGSTLSIVSPERYSSLAESFIDNLTQIHQEYSHLFGDIPPFVTTLRLMDEESFYLTTKAPRWTNAMYFRGQIIIPVADGDKVDIPNLLRSVKHEYTHAVIHSLTGGRCPGWLDEGLAQWAEGAENPALQPALMKWLEKNPPVDLALLQGGFTKLDTKLVAAAYAQSLYAANSVISGYGFAKVRRYFELLRNGRSKSGAFEESFGLSETDFEGQMGRNLADWAHEHHDHGQATVTAYRSTSNGF